MASDSGLAAGVFATANSAAFGRVRRVAELEAAVTLIGVDVVQAFALARSSRLLDAVPAGCPTAGRHHAIETACAARLLAGRVGFPESGAFAAGLLHDVGERLLWQHDARPTPDLLLGPRRLGRHRRPAAQQRGLFGADHATDAREQLTAWGLPGRRRR